ncbi:hypothetical protein NI813_27390, partial [Escherichia coli]|uniref:hypothetical protein n=1 Tax=Escherichia coli TaxID=562 RepID=UPI00209B4F05
SPSRYFSDTTFLNSNENFSMHPQFLVWCLTFGAQFKNDGHYFCRAGGNRPDGLNEPVTLVASEDRDGDLFCSYTAAFAFIT